MCSPLYEKAKKIIHADFDTLCSQIEPTEKEKYSISASQNKIRDILRNSTDIHVIDSFLTGSYARHTMIRPLKDVDFFVVMNYEKHKNDRPIQLMNKIRKVLSRSYPLTPIKISPPCIKVQFDYCYFEVVPAFHDNGELFVIPTEKLNSWQKTYPKIPDEWMTEQNKLSQGLFIPTIKILKKWRDLHCRFLRSFHLEMLTRMAFDSYRIDNYAEGVAAFFRHTNELFQLNKTSPFIQEPGRKGVYVDQYLYDRHLNLPGGSRINKYLLFISKLSHFSS